MEMRQFIYRHSAYIGIVYLLAGSISVARSDSPSLGAKLDTPKKAVEYYLGIRIPFESWSKEMVDFIEEMRSDSAPYIDEVQEAIGDVTAIRPGSVWVGYPGKETRIAQGEHRPPSAAEKESRMRFLAAIDLLARIGTSDSLKLIDDWYRALDDAKKEELQLNVLAMLREHKLQRAAIVGRIWAGIEDANPNLQADALLYLSACCRGEPETLARLKQLRLKKESKLLKQQPRLLDHVISEMSKGN